ncbi:MAG: AAA family ATPase [Eubacterium sp.]|nr:AAA family ATPase [Eubacterium sp.]
MGRYLNFGNAGFASIRKDLYVDKSGVISLLNRTLGTPNKLTCVSRPRRFGKSFTAKMLCAYYDKSCDSRALFSDLEIAKDDSFYRHLNQYDVIYLDITWFLTTTGNIQDTVTYLQQEVIKELSEAFPKVTAQKHSLALALSDICQAVSRKFIIIIDEWDALFRETKENEHIQKEYIKLLRSLFKSSQTDLIVEAAYLTGILPIKKYGTQSALTDFHEYTMIQPMKMAKYMGFTEAEVKELCSQYEIDFRKMKKWYDGYSFRKMKSVYSPNSVMQAVRNEEFSSYWTETETYESLKLYIDMNMDGLKETLIQMLGGIQCEIDTGTFQNDLTSLKSRDDVLTLLVHLGYLAYDADKKSVFIPNEEVRMEFLRAVKSGRHKQLYKIIQASEKLLKDTLNMNSKNVEDAIEYIHKISAAPTFYNNEQALRSVIRFAYISCAEDFQEIQELPSGTGYADVAFLPKKFSGMPVIIVELKWNKSPDRAIHQIRERDYAQVFAGYGGEVLFVGITYDVKTKKHSCVIEKQYLSE